MHKSTCKIKFSASAEWMEPFVAAARELVPLELLKEIRTYRTPLTKQEDSEGLIDRNTRGRYIIRIRSTQHVWETTSNDPLTLKLKDREPRMLWFILSALAHELSHLVHWDHNIEHLKLENRIMLRFCKVLTQKEVKDLYKRGIA